MQERASEPQIDAVIARLVEFGVDVHRSSGATRTVLGVVGAHKVDAALIGVLDGVHEVLRISEPYTRASRTSRPADTVIELDGLRLGGPEVIVMAGPPAAESPDQVMRTAAAAKSGGARVLRGGTFLSRSSAYGFQGLGEEGLRLLRRGADRHGLKLMSEVVDVSQVSLVEAYADVLQVGAPHMHNTALLREVGRSAKPVVVTRGVAATVEEWLLAAECVLDAGNPQVILCEGGVRTFEAASSRAFDISSIPRVKRMSHLPVIADPSQAGGRRDRVSPLARAAVAAGADGLLLAVHPDPDHALIGAAESLSLEAFSRLMGEVRLIAAAIGRAVTAAA